MMYFYSTTIKTKEGYTKSGWIEADNQLEAAAKLRQQFIHSEPFEFEFGIEMTKEEFDRELARPYQGD